MPHPLQALCQSSPSQLRVTLFPASPGSLGFGLLVSSAAPGFNSLAPALYFRSRKNPWLRLPAETRPAPAATSATPLHLGEDKPVCKRHNSVETRQQVLENQPSHSSGRTTMQAARRPSWTVVCLGGSVNSYLPPLYSRPPPLVLHVCPLPFVHYPHYLIAGLPAPSHLTQSHFSSREVVVV